jgi:hypothetical protein
VIGTIPASVLRRSRLVQSDILSSNLEALIARQPGWRLPVGSGQLTCASGVWCLAGAGGSVAIHGREPAREADRQVEAVLAAQPEAPVLTVVGLGLGYVLEALERRQWPGRVLALEPEPDTIEPLLARRDWRAWITRGRLGLLAGPDYAGADACRPLLGNGAGELTILENPALARLRPEAVKAARAAAARLQFDVRANAEARRTHGARYLLNTLANLRAIAAEGDAADLAGVAAGAPAVVVGAGPSLDTVLDTLRQVRERAVIVCVDTALRPLLAAGIAPHVVVAIDPADVNARHLWDLPPVGGTCLAAEASLAPPALEAFRGRTFFFSVSNHQPWPWLSEHGHARGRVRAWGSVLTSAFDLAVQMGCNPVVMTGSDLAFTGDRPYARGVVYETDWRRLYEWGVPYATHWRETVASWPRVEEPDVHGQPTSTASHLVAFRNWLVEQSTRDTSRVFINATGAGILHGGRWQQMSLADAAASWPAHGAADVDLQRRHQPKDGRRLLSAARQLAGALDADPAASCGPLRDWQDFADRVTPQVVRDALRRALDGPPSPRRVESPSARAGAAFDAEWMTPLAQALDLTWWPVPVVQLEPHATGVRRFRPRSSLARIVACSVALPDGGVMEDGQLLRRGAWIDTLQPGEYYIWRDEVYLASTDGSDPGHNGRTYRVLMPACVAWIESLPGYVIEGNKL